MRSIHILIITGVLLAVTSCTPSIEQFVGDRFAKEVTFEASFADEASTKTSVQSDGASVWWSAHESINIFYGSSESSLFTSTNDEPVARAQFRGMIPAFTGETEGGGISYFWAIYPYNADNTCDGSSVTATLPANQLTVAETFADRQWLTIAKSQGLSLSFYAVGAGFRFSVTKEGVKSVTFRGNNNEVLAGKARITMDGNNRPVIQEYLEPETEITLSAPAGETLEVGTLYYFTFFPNNFENGFTITFNTATETGTRIYNSAVNFNRTDVHRGRNFDQDVVYNSRITPEEPPITPENHIIFADLNLKAKLVAAFDTNKDGELSLTEAQAVTTLEGVFGNTRTFKSFDEFQFFTGVTEIPANFFSGWYKMTSITLPESIQTIHGYAFYNCYKLDNIGISKSVSSIEIGAFSGCTNLKRVNITDIASWCQIHFYDNGSQPLQYAHRLYLNGEEITSVVIPDSVTTIGKFAFYCCTSIISVIFHNNVTNIGNCAFEYCGNLLSVVLPNCETHIGNYTFAYCTNLSSIFIPENDINIGKNVFTGCTRLVSFSGKYASEDHRCLIVDGRLCEFAPYGLSSYSIPNNVTCIGAEPFNECTSLTSIVIPNNVTTIEGYAFYGCSNLESIIISNSLTNIGYNAFFNISDTIQLTSSAIGSQLANYINATIVHLIIPEGLTTIDTDAYLNYTKLASVVIPQSMTKIGLHAFKGCTNLTSVVIPDNVTILGAFAFTDCTSLMSVVIPESVKTIRTNTFSGCTNLSAVYIPNSVTNIMSDAFNGCTSLTSISLPSSLSTIGDYVFSGCTNLTSVIIHSASPPTLGSSSKPMDDNNAIIYVPHNSVSTYKNRSGWSQYSERIQAIP